MLKLLPLGLVTLLLIKCSKDIDAEGDKTYECKYLPGITDTSSRAAFKTLKGHVLFSWKNHENGWNYSIVPNLNVSPAEDNVNISNTFTGEDCLKENLSFFAEGEEFFWCRQGSIETPDGHKIILSSPPDDVVEDLIEFCDQMEIQLTISF